MLSCFRGILFLRMEFYSITDLQTLPKDTAKAVMAYLERALNRKSRYKSCQTIHTHAKVNGGAVRPQVIAITQDQRISPAFILLTSPSEAIAFLPPSTNTICVQLINNCRTY